jgi:WD40 repeat protein
MLRTLDPEKFYLEKTGLKNPENIHAVALKPSIGHIACGSDHGTLAVWNYRLNHKILLTDQPHPSIVSCFDFGIDRKLLACGSHDKFVSVWELPTQNPTTLNRIAFLGALDHKVKVVKFLPDDSVLCGTVGDLSSEISVWSSRYKKKVFSLVTKFKYIFDMAVDFNSRMVAIVAGNDKVYLYKF